MLLSLLSFSTYVQAQQQRVIVLGFDGLDPALCRQWMSEGRLPNLSRLADSGTFRELGTSYPAQSPVAWRTLATGVNPGGHGIFDFLGRIPGTYLPTISTTAVERQPFLNNTWQRTAIGFAGGAFPAVILLITLRLFRVTLKPFYTKARGWWANITIALPRGCLLRVAGWGCVASITASPEPWFIGSVFMLFLLGAASTKDFADVKGDEAAGVKTLPVIYGSKRTASIITPFLIFPWLALPVGAWLEQPLVNANSHTVLLFALIMASYGVAVGRMMRRGAASGLEGNHPAWFHMCIMMLAAQIGLPACYFV